MGTSTLPATGARATRPATPDDAPALLVWMTAFNASERIPFDPAQAAVPLDRLLRDPSLGAVSVILDDGDGRGPQRAVGYAVVTHGFDLEWGGRDAFLTELFVEPGSRRRGLAARALDELCAGLRREGAGALHLGVWPDNAPALALYRRSGFQPVPRTWMTKRLR